MTVDPVISRAEGYRRGRGKEALGVTTVRVFLADHGVPTTLIVGADDNYRFGDLRGSTGATVEVKRQPIDPDQHPRNYVEIGEVTTNPRHAGGFTDLADLLGVTPDALAATRFADRRPGAFGATKLGSFPSLAVSLRSMFAARFTAYVNPDGGHLYLYGRGEITNAVRTAVRCGPITRAAGNSNQDTLGVRIPLSCHRWTRPTPTEPWEYTGDGLPEQALSRLRDVLGGPP